MAPPRQAEPFPERGGRNDVCDGSDGIDCAPEVDRTGGRAACWKKCERSHLCLWVFGRAWKDQRMTAGHDESSAAPTVDATAGQHPRARCSAYSTTFSRICARFLVALVVVGMPYVARKPSLPSRRENSPLDVVRLVAESCHNTDDKHQHPGRALPSNAVAVPDIRILDRRHSRDTAETMQYVPTASTSGGQHVVRRLAVLSHAAVQLTPVAVVARISLGETSTESKIEGKLTCRHC
jgi:hypothetical protein